eukprot:EG_transcript_3952
MARGLRWPLQAARWWAAPSLWRAALRLFGWQPTVRCILPPSSWITLATAGTGPGGAGEGRRPARHVNAEVQAHLNGYGVDIPKVLTRYPHIVSYDLERVQRVTSFLARLPVDVRHVVECCPVLLAGRVENFEAVVQVLRDNGVDVVRAVTKYPDVLRRPKPALQSTMDAIASCGHAVADVVHRCPTIFRCSAKGVSSTLQLLQTPDNTTRGATVDEQQSSPTPDVKLHLKGMLLSSLGLNADRVLRRRPQLVAISYQKLHTMVEYLRGLGVDVPKVAQAAPSVFALRPEAVQERVQFLEKNGLDVVHHVNGFPWVLCYSVEQNLLPTLSFVVQEMERTPSSLNGAYNIWGCSLNGRLRPRFLYLKSLGRSSRSLSQLASFSDERFVTSLAGTDLEHYSAWRQQNGYPIHHGDSGASPRPFKGGRPPGRGTLCPEVQAHLSLYGIHMEKVIQRYPSIVSHKLQRVERMGVFLLKLGVDVKRVVEKYPRILAGDVDAYKAIVRLLEDNKVEVARAINGNPSIFSRGTPAVQQMIDVITSRGYVVADVVHRFPGIFRSNVSDISSILQFLQRRTDAAGERLAGQQSLANSFHTEASPKGALFSSMGLDADRLLRKFPQLMALSLDNLSAVVDYLKALGVDVPKVAHSAPSAFGMRLETLQRRVQFLSENGMDVVRHVNGSPMVLSYSVEQNLQPTLDFVVQEMGCSPALLNGAYNVWGCSVENRLRPRFLYLKSLGRSLPGLSRFASFSDERFATLLAGTDLQHYHAWRLQNGFSVPARCLPI